MATEHLRASNGDRAHAAERLRVAVDEGRLDLMEYDERLQAAYAARTYGELTALLADLPGPAPAKRAALAPVNEPAQGTPAMDENTGTWFEDARSWLARVWGRSERQGRGR